MHCVSVPMVAHSIKHVLVVSDELAVGVGAFGLFGLPRNLFSFRIELTSAAGLA